MTVKLTADEEMRMRQAAVRVHSDFDGIFSQETIERFIVDSRQELGSRRADTSVLPVLVERFTRDRLHALARVEGRIDASTPAALFACVHNAGRSQMAAGWLRHLAQNRVEVFSGGSDPGGQLNAGAVAAMAEVGIDIADEYPRPWTKEIVQAADIVVTMGCGDACPVFPGKRYEDWELSDPAGLPLEQIRPIRDEIGQMVRMLLTSLDAPARARRRK